MKSQKTEKAITTIRLDKTLRNKLDYMADYENRTMSNMLETIIKERIAKFEKKYGAISV